MPKKKAEERSEEIEEDVEEEVEEIDEEIDEEEEEAKEKVKAKVKEEVNLPESGKKRAFREMIDVYKKQNPEKYFQKAERLTAKLNEMK